MPAVVWHDTVRGNYNRVVNLWAGASRNRKPLFKSNKRPIQQPLPPGIKQFSCIALLLVAVLSSCAFPNAKRKPLEKKTTEELLQDLTNGNEDVKIAVIRRLVTSKDQTALFALKMVLDDPSDSVAIAAADALGDLNDSQAIEPLWHVNQDPKRSPSLRFAAACALARLGDIRVADPLINALPDNYAPASMALARLGKAAVPPLIEALRMAEKRDNASKVLITMGNTALEPLINLLRNKEIKSDRLAAASTLAEMDEPAASEALDEALKNPDPELAWAAYRFLIRKGRAGTEAQLTRTLDTYGRLPMAEDFFASGNPVLKAAAETWAQKRKYPLTLRTSDVAEVHWGGVNPSLKRLGLYHFDGSLTSTSGMAPVQASGVSFVPGKWGSALSVEKGGILKYPLNGNLDFQNGTIEMWISPRFDGTDPVYSKYNHALLLYHSPANDQFLVSESTLGGFYAGSVVHHQFRGAGGGNISNWKPGTWHHIAFTYSSNPTRQRFYVDGSLINENTVPMPEPDPGANLTVGCDPYGNWTGFLIDELEISSGAKGTTAIGSSALRKAPFADH